MPLIFSPLVYWRGLDWEVCVWGEGGGSKFLTKIQAFNTRSGQVILKQ